MLARWDGRKGEGDRKRIEVDWLFWVALAFMTIVIVAVIVNVMMEFT